MHQHRSSPSLPSRKTLIRFFGDRRPVTLALAAQLLGFPEEWVRARAAEDAALLPGEKLPWEDVMFWFLDVWPLDAVVSRLKPDADVLLPLGLHLRNVQWRLPGYLVLAVETQAALATGPTRGHHKRSLSAYLAEQLHNIIDDSTVAALAGDADFLAAFHYPAER